ncbi:hypothetical protein G4Y79_02195 [Phototrophicus methaneseepsis]|uniref:Uncharacterized protein n=1 Tax=Phototrophicus methaneseepsis TaxID=2710758 RepID=A0A7S8EA42_9CHLR|nr:hypothetical protein [Phototrophicus methaneseepsis]QPC83208.1 hypothetical protein G4Y79_02195 [Phototrophicus methaneseepsis]
MSESYTPHITPPRDSKYSRARHVVSWWGLFIGLVIGLSGGLFYAWNIAPLEEFDTTPRQLNPESKTDYVVAIMLSHAYNSDLGQTINRLSELNLGLDPIGSVATAACDLARSGYVDSSAGVRAIRYMQTFYELQGRQSCADSLLPEVEVVLEATISVPTATPTLPPPPTKTPTLRPDAESTQAAFVVVPTSVPERAYEGGIGGTYCDSELSGLIEVRVVDFNGQGIGGEMIRVRWDGGEDRFVTGLKPERDVEYADFKMEAGRSYIVDMPGLSDPISSAINANPCTTASGEQAVTSYYVTFRRVG